MSKTIQQVEYFGAIDAENDKDLLANFYRAGFIEELIDGTKSIVIGRKGTGKSAIYTYICDKFKDEAVRLEFKDYPWKLHDRFSNTVVPERERYVNSWEFLLYIEIAKRIIVDTETIWSKEEKKQIKYLTKWIKNNWGSIDFDYKENLNPHKFKFIFAPQILGNGLGSISKEVASGNNIGQSVGEYNKKLQRIIFNLLKTYKKNIYLAFDQLDLAYAYEDSKYKEKLIGLLLATYNFHNKFPKVKVIIFLRSDIFAGLTFQDKNKIKDNLVEFLDWDAEKDTGLSLKNLIKIRIKNAFDLKTDSFEECWQSVFSNDKIGKNQFKWKYIVERTFLRPRDIIKFMNLAIKQAKNSIEKDDQRERLIINDDIYNIKTDYSNYLYEELKDEMSGKYPDFNNYLEILREIHIDSFTKSEFDLKYDIIKQRMDIKEVSDVVMERLYEFSIIGFYKPGGGGYGGSEYRYQYTSDNQKFNPTASKYRVHPGYKEYLELIEKRTSK